MKVTIFSTLPKRVNIWNRNKKKKLEGIENCCSAIDVAIRTIVVLLGHNNNTIGHLPSLVTISTTTEGGKASKPREGRKEGRKEQAHMIVRNWYLVQVIAKAACRGKYWPLLLLIRSSGPLNRLYV